MNTVPSAVTPVVCPIATLAVPSGRRQSPTRELLLLTLCVLAVPTATPAVAQTREPRQFEVRQAAAAIALDGRLDDEAWRQADAIPLPYEYFPGDNIAAPFETVCRVT